MKLLSPYPSFVNCVFIVACDIETSSYEQSNTEQTFCVAEMFTLSYAVNSLPALLYTVTKRTYIHAVFHLHMLYM
jgi:hypothetical protein